jgi:hypothetical protein
MLRSKIEKLKRPLALLPLMVLLVVCFHVPSAAVSQTQSQGAIKDGIGLGEILIGVSTAADVEARYGLKYELMNRNEYSYRMDYADQGLAFYYCYKDAKKRVFLVEAHQGVTSKGIIIGKSTLADVFKLYGEEGRGGDSYILEYPGIQFYIECDPTPEGEKAKPPALDKKVVEVDVVAPDKASNFCD